MEKIEEKLNLNLTPKSLSSSSSPSEPEKGFHMLLLQEEVPNPASSW
jgi:hypothetical protein